MDSLLSLDVDCGEWAGFSCLDDTTASLLNYQGRFVRTFNSPCDTFFGQLNMDQNSALHVNPLSEFSVAPLTQASSDSFDESDLSVILESICGQYVTRDPDKEFVDEVFPVSGSSLCSQSYLSESEPDLSEQTPSNRLNPNHDLTTLPADIANPQDSRPVTVANPLSLQQATSDNPVNSTKIFADKSPQAERKRKRYQNNPAFAQRLKEYQRKRYRNDPAIAERRRVRRKERYRTDLAFAERQRKRQRQRRQDDPVYIKARKIHNNTYNKMKRKVSKEEASRLASVARAEYLQSVNSSEDSGNLPQLPIQLRQHNTSKI